MAEAEYEYFVDGDRYAFAAPTITGFQIRAKLVGPHAAERQLLLERHNQDDLILDGGDEVRLDGEIQRFYTLPSIINGG